MFCLTKGSRYKLSVMTSLHTFNLKLFHLTYKNDTWINKCHLNSNESKQSS